MGTARQKPSPESLRHMAPNVGDGVAPPVANGWPYFPFQPGVPCILWFTGTRFRQFLEDYEVLAARMQYTDREKARRIADYVVPELRNEIYYTIEYEDGDWTALRALLIEQFDTPDRLLFQQELDMLTEEKWRLEDIAKKSHRFTYLWRKAYGQYHNDEEKTRRYIEALPNELVWATVDGIHNDTELRTFEEVVKVIVVRAKRILNIQYNRKQRTQRSIPRSDVVSKNTPFEVVPCPQNNMADTAATAPAPAALAVLKERLEELECQ
ncbi:hypothetical protein EV182_007859, partial [Spiromyces aspiralis]